MICPLYDAIRTTLITSLQQLNLYVPINHKLLLSDTNLLIQEHLSTYLIVSKTNRHDHNKELNTEMHNFYFFTLVVHSICPFIIRHNLPKPSPYLPYCIITQPVCYTNVSNDVLFYSVKH